MKVYETPETEVIEIMMAEQTITSEQPTKDGIDLPGDCLPNTAE